MQHYDFIQAKNSFNFSEDALHLAKYCTQLLNNNDKVLDLGTACGVIALSILMQTKHELQVLGLDKFEDHIICANLNAKNLKLEHKCDAQVVDFANYMSYPKQLKESFDFAVSNPPWRISGRQSKDILRREALFASLNTFNSFAYAANFFLKAKAKFCVLLSLEVEQAFIIALRENNFYILDKVILEMSKSANSKRVIILAEKK